MKTRMRTLFIIFTVSFVACAYLINRRWWPLYSSASSFIEAAVLAASPAEQPNSQHAVVKVTHVRDLVKDYGAGTKDREISAILQTAVDDIGAAGGGTIVIPSMADAWHISRPVLVGYPNITIVGEGAGTTINGSEVMFVLGLGARERGLITKAHRPPTTGKDGVLDSSVTDTHFGLRTFDGAIPAAGYFQLSPLAFGNRIPPDPSGDYWKDYARGSGKPTYWYQHPLFTMNLVVTNNDDKLMKGEVCGVGGGGLTPESTTGRIDDPTNIWTIESDPVSGKNLCFKFKFVAPNGVPSIQSLALAPEGAGPGTHRISVQLDFTTGQCRAWYSVSRKRIRPPALCTKLDLPKGGHLAAFEYGAFRLGRVVTSPIAGSPSNGHGDGDWTYCGLSVNQTVMFDTGPDSDELGAPQLNLDRAPATDAYRYFRQPNDKCLVSCLPLNSDEPDVLVPFQNGPLIGTEGGFGFWLPTDRATPIGGTFKIGAMRIFGGIVVGQAEHVVVEDIYQGGGGFYHGLGTMNFGNSAGLLEVHNCRFVGLDAAIYDHSMSIHADNISGGGGELMFRFIGCRGHVDHVMVTGFVASDYYVKCHAGAVGGPLRFSQFCVDNEGCEWIPRKACFYAEPSLDGGADGNLLSLRGTVYTGSLFAGKNCSFLELADAPGAAAEKAHGAVDIDGIDLWIGKQNLDSLILCRGSTWGGRVQAQTEWAEHFDNGLIHNAGLRPSSVVSFQESYALPAVGAWTAGCNVVQIPDKPDAATGAWTFQNYRCTKSGVYGKNDPQWTRVEARGN